MFFIKTNKKITRKSFIIASSFFACAFFVFTAIAAPDQELTYHGKLTDTLGIAVPNGNYDFTLSIYDAASGGTCLWTARGTCGAPTPKVLSVTNGIYSTVLGGSGDNVLDLAFDANYYLEITIGTNTPMSPRRKVTPTGFALNAHRLNGLTADNYINTGAVAQTKQGNLIIGGDLAVDGIFYDSDGHAGTSGQILSTTATGTDWITQTDSDVLAALSCINDQVPQWNGTTWICVTVSGGGMAIGDAITSATAGSVLFADATGILAQDNANFYYDSTSKRLGIGTNTPSANLEVKGSVTDASLGVEQVTNGTFDTNATGWTTTTWTWGTARINHMGAAGAIASVANGGIILNTGGTGYTNGDVLTLTNGANNATVTVTSVSAGKITGFNLTLAGTACMVNANVSTTGGTGTGASFSIVRLVDSANTLSQNVSVVNANMYQITYTVTRSLGELNVTLGGVNGHKISAAGTYTQVVTASGTGNLIFTPTVDFVGSIDAISVKQINTAAAVASMLNSDGTAGLEMRAGGTGLYNTFLGNKSGVANSTGNNNVSLGAYAFSSNSTGYFNTAIGAYALSANTTGLSNSALGYRALSANTTGMENAAFGTQALLSNTTGRANASFGYAALYSNTTGGFNTASGAFALRGNTTGSYNTALGYAALYNNTTGYNNVSMGYFALYNNTTGYNNVVAGYQALIANTTGYNNIAMGQHALNANITGYNNIALGYTSGYLNTTGFNNISLGSSSLRSNTTGNSNTALGVSALYNNITGTSNNALGFATLYSNTTGNFNTAVGDQSLYFNTTGFYNTALGSSALNSNTTGAYNAAVSTNALYDLRPTSAAITAFADAGSGNVTVTSTNSLTNGDSITISGTANYNGTYIVANRTVTNFTIVHAFVATETGWWQKTGEGQYNTALGYNTGRGVVTGSGNTVLGAQITGLAANLTNNIILANGTGAIKAQHDGTNWNFTNNVLPSVDNSYSLGSGTFRWNAVYAANGTINTSDITLKKDITNLSYGLTEILAINPITFNWRDSALGSQKKIGFSAQELQGIIPEVVRDNGGTLGVYYSDLIPVTVNAIKEQQKLIQTNTNDLTTKANATSVSQLQEMTDDQFIQVSTLLRSTHVDDGTLRDDIELLFVENANMRSDILDEVDIRIADRLQGMDEDFETIMTFADVAQDIIVDADRLIRTDDEGGLTIEGVMVAGRIETGALVITGEEKGATIGSAAIAEGAYDVFVSTTAVVQNSRIFVTPKRDVVTQTLSITRIDDDSGFHVTVAKPVDKPLEFDWMIVEDQVIREGQKHVDEVTDQKPVEDVDSSNELVITAEEGIVN